MRILVKGDEELANELRITLLLAKLPVTDNGDYVVDVYKTKNDIFIDSIDSQLELDLIRMIKELLPNRGRIVLVKCDPNDRYIRIGIPPKYTLQVITGIARGFLLHVSIKEKTPWYKRL